MDELFNNRLINVFKTVNSPAPEVGLTPRQAVWKKNKATLWYYPAQQKKYDTPLYFIYSLLNQPFILDLGPGYSLIKFLNEKGFDIYLLDFGIPTYADKDLTVDDYILRYIKKGVQRTLIHSGASQISIIGFCMGGTFASIYAAIADEPIQNLILAVAPIDFSYFPIFDEWQNRLRDGELDLETIFDTAGVIPSPLMKAGIRLFVSPVYVSPYLSLLRKSYDEEYALKWKRLNFWAESHIPFSGAALKQMIQTLGIENGLMNGTFLIDGTPVNLSNIHANLLAVGSNVDRLVPKEQIQPVMDLVSSKDKTFFAMKGGHATLATNKEVQEFLSSWLSVRSNPIRIS
ncbi:alpha/beta fold hydrolase [Cytobacillus gottheilii]|uniref:Alpha/beta fold hydrolase n=2 Tax=Cytobacillus gottheilii TaxID=859144 RepID=A0ABX8FIK2_9BACI|nr:alpha/beta fold hydrolase [Cytobacillus gottheilii]